MSTCPTFDHLVVLPRLRIQNANAISSPSIHGFPSMTAFLGLSWALQRKARQAGLDASFVAVGVVCHDYQEQVYREGRLRFCLTRNPLDKDGGTAAIVEEGRIHLCISLVFAVRSPRWLAAPDRSSAEADLKLLADMLAGMRVAGGSCLPSDGEGRRHRPVVLSWTGTSDDRADGFRRVRQLLLPGFALVLRDELVDARLAELRTTRPDSSRLDAWLSMSRVNWRWRPPAAGQEAAEPGSWQHDRKSLGWVVPIPVGYGALGEVHAPGAVAKARDATTPFRFVETVYSIGQWLAPHQLDSAEQLLWYSDHDRTTGLYRCRNDFGSNASPQAIAWGDDD
ncbi:CRISPR-associated protein, Csy2 family [Piscinibacter sakaiensis]|uniref:CRISPR-associated protein, Csy2 family n=2 Tax=Piscinibacter sakaiensis TaxID=1547922 RepID=A0A0K8P4X6_PISS1|nr:CRISPR-associated protein, Csy2 family [Piscinibacter sakaiensis]